MGCAEFQARGDCIAPARTNLVRAERQARAAAGAALAWRSGSDLSIFFAGVVVSPIKADSPGPRSVPGCWRWQRVWSSPQGAEFTLAEVGSDGRAVPGGSIAGAAGICIGMPGRV